MATELKELTLEEVSLVDKPANEHAKVVLFKASCKPEEMAKGPKGIKFVIGFPKDGGSEVQSVVFSTDDWTAADARAWLKDHDMESGKMDETDNSLRFRQQDPGKYERFRTIEPGAQMEKALRAKTSLYQIQGAVERAVREAYQKPTKAGELCDDYVFIRDIFRDTVVFEQSGKLYRADYEIMDSPEIAAKVGERYPVEISYVDTQKAAEQVNGAEENDRMKEEKMDEATQKRLSDLEAANKRLETVTKLSADDRAAYDAFTTEEQEAFHKSDAAQQVATLATKRKQTADAVSKEASDEELAKSAAGRAILDLRKELKGATERARQAETRIAAAESVAKSEREKRLTTEFAKRAEIELPALPGTSEEKGAALQSLEKLSTEEREAIVKLLHAGNEGMTQLGKPIGATVRVPLAVGKTAQGGGNAWARITKMAEKMVSENAGTKLDEAIGKICLQHPEIYDEYLAEQSGR